MAVTLVIFGASGDLTSRKLVPALYKLFRKKRLPADTRIVGFSRTEFTHEAWRAALAESTPKFLGQEFDRAALGRVRAGDLLPARRHRPRRRFRVAAPIAGRARRLEGCHPRLLSGHGPAVLRRSRRPAGRQRPGRRAARPAADRHRKTVRHRPGQTARELNESLHRVFAEHQVYRIDHYLGKETVQNMLVLRFANTIFEPIWNRNYIDHVQITAAEEVTVGRRGGLLRLGGHAPRHVPEPPAATDDRHGHGGARALRGRRGPRRKGQGAAGHPRR